MKQKNFKSRIVFFVVLFVCVAVIIEMAILITINKNQAARTSQIILNQIDNILSSNEHNEQIILEDLKIEYVDRANTVAYILSNNESAQTDVSELTLISDMMRIDEIHLFDSQGVMYSGTVPEYYGLTFNDGEQVAFFKPMLEDRSLTMCQDVTPNTAEAKSMMYAITWDPTGTYMVQVGIEPVRLIEELRENSIRSVVNQMPAYDGMNIYISDINSGEILGTTDHAYYGRTIYDKGILKSTDNPVSVENKSIHLDGFRSYCYFLQHDNYLIAVVHSTESNIENFFVSLVIEIMWLLIAASVIVYVLFRLLKANDRINNQMSVMKSIADIYYSMHLIDMSDFNIIKLEGNELMDQVVTEGQNANDMLSRIIKTTVEEEFIDPALSFSELTTLRDRLENKNSIFIDVIDKNVGWLRISFITVESDSEKKPTKVIITTQVIDEEKKKFEDLSQKANVDELTGLLNRRAYEDDILNYPDVPPELDFVYAAIDINGLKVVNDELGHVAGDELIRGATACLKTTFGNYGRVYRTGGDEFVAMFFADEEHLNDIVEDLANISASWSGQYISSISLAVGCVTKREFMTLTVTEMAKIADERMYKAKNEYYARKGVDRKGQAAAHTALCNLYTKILKINITEDSYSIVNMDLNEQTSKMGFSDKISEWLHDFGTSGQVHPEDLSDYLAKTDINYLREYFKADKTSISVYYRRKYLDNTYKHVIMEMIPANDYSDDNQSLFLYVKSIDK